MKLFFWKRVPLELPRCSELLSCIFEGFNPKALLHVSQILVSPQAVFPIVSGRCRSQNLLLRGDNPCSEADLGSTVLMSHTEQEHLTPCSILISFNPLSIQLWET